MSESLKATNRGLHRFTIVLTGLTFLLLAAGALVTSNDAGLSVPDWPLSYGSLFPPMVGGIFYEHGHRMIATLVGILTIVLAIWLWRRDPRAWMRRLGLAAVGLIITQGILGGITVKFFLPPPISMAHATLAQLFFITMISMVMFTGDWWQSDQLAIQDTGSPALNTITVATTASIVLQIALGAGYRHGAFGIAPHIVGFFLVTFFVVMAGRTVRRRFDGVRPLRTAVICLHAFFGIQVLLGLAAYWAVAAEKSAPQPLPLLVAITVAHVLAGSLTLAASAVLTLQGYRLTRPACQVPVSHSGKHAGA
jgi:cytochrome c oxidase assembly protein subunit 15